MPRPRAPRRAAPALLLAGAAAFDPFAEPPVQAAFAPLRDFRSDPAEYAGPTAAIPRVKLSDFPSLAAAREAVFQLALDGQPFVVEDPIEDGAWPFKELGCEGFARRWPSGDMRDEYDHQGRMLLGDETWYTKFRPTPRRQPLHLSQGAAVAASYVWHVKDETPPWMKREVQQGWRTPWFLNHSTVNTNEGLESFEMWFALPQGGVFAHSDSYCEMTASWQLRGRKQWRLMHFPPHDDGAADRFESFDEGIYSEGQRRWYAEYDFGVGPGELFVFPPSYMHETQVFPEENAECTVASTFQFQLPVPARFLRRYLNRIVNSALGYEERCHERWAVYPTLGAGYDDDGRPPRLTPKAAAFAPRVDTAFALIDADGDGRLTLAEVRAFFAHSHEPGAAAVREFDFGWQPATRAQRAAMLEEVLDARAREALAWNDRDEDGAVTKAELWESVAQWNLVLTRAHHMNKMAPSVVAPPPKLQARLREWNDKFLQKYGRVENPYRSGKTEL